METRQTETREPDVLTPSAVGDLTGDHAAERTSQVEATSSSTGEERVQGPDSQAAPTSSTPTPSGVEAAQEMNGQAELASPASEAEVADRPAETPAADGHVAEATASAATAAVTAEAPATGASTGPALTVAKLVERAEALAKDIEEAANKVYFLGRVRRLLADAEKHSQEGVAAVVERLKALEQAILEQVEQRKHAKEALVARAEELSNSTTWKATGEAFRALLDEWKAIGPTGRELDDQLWSRFQAARDAFNERRAAYFAERQQQWAANRVRKEELVARAEALADSTDWRATSEAMRALQAEWKTVGSAGREADEELWSRFRGAQDRFFDNRAAAYEANRQRKEELCVRAEELADSTEWRETAETMKALQAEWKTIGPCGKEADEELWQRFRAATQHFFTRRAAAYEERQREEQENLRRKEELCAAAEALTYAADPVAATEEAKALQAEWKTIGPIRRDRAEALWARFRKACDTIFENAAAERARRRSEWETKLQDALMRKREQVYRLKESITLDESAIARWETALSNPRPTESPDVLRAKIADVSQRIKEKRQRVEELEASIRDIQSKLTR